MKPITREWIDKAEGDWATASREIRTRKRPNYDAVCFHAQQCAEKYLKAWLQEANITFGKSHDLLKLLASIVQAEASWSVLKPDLNALTDFAVEYRYPGSSATKAEARDALTHCRNVRRVIRRSFGLLG
jgi:HEPN domain-containing protein